MDSTNINKKAIAVASHSPSDKIILTGFMGCGKSYLSSQLASALGFDLYDTDSMIEAKINISIKDIFDIYDEAYFRSLEAELALEIKNNFHRAVFATGGGFPIFYEDILEIGTVFYMDIPFEKILERMTEEEREKRPLFRDLDRVKSLYNSRLNCYKERSHYIIDATQPVELMISLIKELLNRS